MSALILHIFLRKKEILYTRSFQEPRGEEWSSGNGKGRLCLGCVESFKVTDICLAQTFSNY